MMFAKYLICLGLLVSAADTTNHTFYEVSTTAPFMTNDTFGNDKTTQASITSDTFCKQNTTPGFIAYILVLSVTLIGIVIGNAIVIMVHRESAILRLPSSYLFVISLAVGDLGVAVVIIPMKIIQALHNDYFCTTKFFCHLYANSELLFAIASISNIFSVTVYRFIHIMFPYEYVHMLTFFRVKIWIFGVWLYSILCAVLLHYNPKSRLMDNIKFVNGHKCYCEDPSYQMILIIVGLVCPTILTGFMHIVIHLKATSHHSDIKRKITLGEISLQSDQILIPHESQSDEHSYMRNIRSAVNRLRNALKRTNWKSTKVLLLVYGSFGFWYMPFVVMITLIYYKNVYFPRYATVLFMEFFPLMESAFNPLLYSACHQVFRKELKRKLLFRIFPILKRRDVKRKAKIARQERLA